MAAVGAGKFRAACVEHLLQATLEEIMFPVKSAAFQDSERIVSGTLAELARVDFGPPLHSLVLPGTLHDLEGDMVRAWRCAPGDCVYDEEPGEWEA